jgi:hypothetical protein
MRLLDRTLTSPHRLAVFAGGHTLPPDEVALEAIEWMELQAMKSGARARDAALVDRLFAKRHELIAKSSGSTDTVHLLEDLVADFTGLRDVSAEAKRANELSGQRDIKKALDRERAADDEERRAVQESADLEAALTDENRRMASLMTLRDRLSKLAERGAEPAASPERTRARRILRAVTAGAADRVKDPEYRAMLQQYSRR